MNDSFAYMIFERIKNAGMLVLVPIILTIVFASAYSKVFVENIPMGVIDNDNSTLSRQIIKYFSDGPSFHVTLYANTDSELEDAIKARKVRAGIVIPKDFSKDVNQMKAPKVMFLIDETNLVIGNNAMSYGGSILNTLNAGAQLNVLESKGMVPYAADKAVKSLSFTERLLYDPQLSYMKYLFYGILGIFVQQTFVEVLGPALIEERQRMKKMKMLSWMGVRKIAEIILRIIVMVVLTYVGFSSCLYILGKYYNLPLKGTILNSYILLAAFILDLTAVSFVFATIFDSTISCAETCMFLSVPTILTSGYVWPEYMMPAGFSAIVRHVWPLIYFINPLREINMKGSGMSTMLPYIQGALNYAAIWLPIGVGAYIIKIIIPKVLIRKLKQIEKEEKSNESIQSAV